MSEVTITLQKRYDLLPSKVKNDLKRLFCELAAVCIDINTNTKHQASFRDIGGLGVVQADVFLYKADDPADDNIELFDGRVNYLLPEAVGEVQKLVTSVRNSVKRESDIKNAKAVL